MSKKLCSKCRKLKALGDFHRSGFRRLKSMCRDCWNRRQRAYRKNRRIGHTLALFPDNSPGRAGGRSGPEKPPDKKQQRRCRYQVGRAVKMGILVRAERCSICDRTRDEVAILYAHHEDYTRPLSVKFLCPSCHAITHHHLRDRRNRAESLFPPQAGSRKPMSGCLVAEASQKVEKFC